jgi:hypothetical protein
MVGTPSDEVGDCPPLDLHLAQRGLCIRNCMSCELMN